MPPKYVAFSLLALTTVLLIYIFSQFRLEGVSHVGTLDLYAFWAGAQVFLDGGNPYSPREVYNHQLLAKPDFQAPQFFFNPPWALPLFSVFFAWSFELSRWIFISVNLLFLAGAVCFLSHSPGIHSHPSSKLALRWMMLAGFLFTPVIMNIMIGQLALMMLFSLSGAVYLIHKRYDISAGLMLVPLSIKPHLFTLFFCYLAVLILREKRWRLFWSGFFGFAFLNLLVAAADPGLYARWIEMEGYSPLDQPTAATLRVLRDLIDSVTGVSVNWLLFALPLVAGLWLFIWLLRKQNFPDLDWHSTVPFLVVGSLLVAPYCWLYDFSLLAPLQIILIATAFSRAASRAKKNAILVSLTLIHLGVIFFSPSGPYWGYLAWFPWAMLVAWCFLSPGLKLQSKS